MFGCANITTAGMSGGGENVSRNQRFAEVILERTLFHQMTNVLNNSKCMLSSGLDNSGDCRVAQCDEGGEACT